MFLLHTSMYVEMRQLFVVKYNHFTLEHKVTESIWDVFFHVISLVMKFVCKYKVMYIPLLASWSLIKTFRSFAFIKCTKDVIERTFTEFFVVFFISPHKTSSSGAFLIFNLSS